MVPSGSDSRSAGTRLKTYRDSVSRRRHEEHKEARRLLKPKSMCRTVMEGAKGEARKSRD